MHDRVFQRNRGYKTTGENQIYTIIAATAGSEHWNEIAMYCKGKIDFMLVQ